MIYVIIEHPFDFCNVTKRKRKNNFVSDLDTMKGCVSMGLFSFLFRRKSKRDDRAVPSMPSEENEDTAEAEALQSPSECACRFRSSYVIVDTETTGLSPYSDKIIQLSAILYNPEGYPVESFNTYINPGIPIPPGASRINGITDDMVRNAPTIEDVQDAFVAFCKNFLLVGYNVPFDLRFLAASFPSHFDEREYVDLLPICRSCLPAPDYKLETVASLLGYTPEGGFHDSLVDCEAVAAVLHELDLPIDEYINSFCAKNDRCTKRRSPRRTSSSSQYISAKDFVPASTGPLLGKTVVFTGSLKIPRHEAAQMAADCGAVVKGTVSKKTDYLVVGEQDLALVGDDGMSTKEEKAYALNASGEADIRIIREVEFLRLVRQRGDV